MRNRVRGAAITARLAWIALAAALLAVAACGEGPPAGPYPPARQEDTGGGAGGGAGM